MVARVSKAKGTEACHDHSSQGLDIGPRWFSKFLQLLLKASHRVDFSASETSPRTPRRKLFPEVCVRVCVCVCGNGNLQACTGTFGTCVTRHMQGCKMLQVCEFLRTPAASIRKHSVVLHPVYPLQTTLMCQGWCRFLDRSPKEEIWSDSLHAT